jgi:hypothetical protein
MELRAISPPARQAHHQDGVIIKEPFYQYEECSLDKHYLKETVSWQNQIGVVALQPRQEWLLCYMPLPRPNFDELSP